MTKSTLTTDAIAGVADLKAGYTLGHADVAILKSLAAELLAVREAQPVEVTDEMAMAFHRALTDSDIGSDDLDDIKIGLRGALCNYNVPPAPALLDERHPVGGDQWGWAGEYNRGWNAYRSAMLQLSGNSEHVNQGYTLSSPVIPDGWKLVPAEPTPKQWAAGLSVINSGIDKVTLIYRAMVAAAPAQGVDDA